MKKIITIIAILSFSLTYFCAPVIAACPLDTFGEALGADNANILKGCASEEDGIMCILNLVLDIMTVSVGIIGVIGISIVGIQYLTGGGNEEKTRTAKRRIFEIVIGLAVFAVIYTLLKWLLPGFSGGGTP